MLITFTVNEQKITHDLGTRQLVAGSSGVVQADFSFDDSWEGFSVVVVFSNSAKRCNTTPVRYTGEPIDIPTSVLIAGKLYVSVIGFADSGLRKTTMKWDIQQAITVQECGALGGCDLLRNLAQGAVPDENVASDEEVEQMLSNVFGEEETEPPETGEPTVDDGSVATDEEVVQMLNSVFDPA